MGLEGHKQDMSPALATTPQEIEERLEDWAKERMKALVADIEDDVALKLVFGQGKAYQEIIKKARTEDVELIVSRARSNSSPTILGQATWPKMRHDQRLVRGWW